MGLVLSTTPAIEGFLGKIRTILYPGISSPSRLLILFLGYQIDNWDLILGCADHLVRVGTVAAQEIGVVHFLLDSEAEVGGQGAGLDKIFYVRRQLFSSRLQTGLHLRRCCFLGRLEEINCSSSAPSKGKLSRMSFAQMAIRLILVRSYRMFQIPSSPM